MNDSVRDKTGNVASCPYIGLLEDSHTLVSSPSASNCCHFCRPITPISFEHQSRFCLTKKHMQCQVHLQMQDQPLPVELRFHQDILKSGGRWRRPVFIIAMLILLAAIFYFVTPMTGIKISPLVFNDQKTSPAINTPIKWENTESVSGDKAIVVWVGGGFLLVGGLLFYVARFLDVKEE